MTRDELLDRAWIDSARCGGQPWIRGNGICASLVLDLLASRATTEGIVQAYGVTTEPVQACISYGSEVDVAAPSRSFAGPPPRR